MSLARIKRLIADANYRTAQADLDPGTAEARRFRSQAKQLFDRANELAELTKPGVNTRHGYAAVVGVQDGLLRVFCTNRPVLLTPDEVTDAGQS